MNLRVAHTTTYVYEEPVSICHNEARLTPRDGPRQRARRTQLVIEPAPDVMTPIVDWFGNHVTFFSLHEPHRRLSVTAMSDVDVEPAPPLDPAASPPFETVRDRLRLDRSPDVLAAYQFVFESPHVRVGPEAAEYAARSFAPGRPLLAAAFELCSRIHADFVYDPEATSIATPVSEVLRERRGVCQDFAHAMLACLRSQGVAARYVSGYLRTLAPPGRERLVGADASHAWISVFSPDVGWVDLDPTNDRLVSDEHVTLAVGRDYADVSPIRGVLFGGGSHTVDVAVDVTPL